MPNHHHWKLSGACSMLKSIAEQHGTNTLFSVLSQLANSYVVKP
jgi:hypothetical protein